MTGHERKKKEDLFSNTIFPQMSSRVVIKKLGLNGEALIGRSVLNQESCLCRLSFNEL